MNTDHIDDDEPLECLEGPDHCQGPVEYRWPGYGTRNWPRCAAHGNDRIDREMDLRQRYPTEPPTDWSPDDAGETWVEEAWS